MKFFVDKNCINHSFQTNKTTVILNQLYQDIKAGDSFIKLQKFVNPVIKKITNISQILRPKTFNVNAFPEEIRTHIDNSMLYELTYTCSLFNREIVTSFIVEHDNPEIEIELYNMYVEKILVWLSIMNKYSSQNCSKKLHIYMYFTSLTKRLPTKSIDIIGQNNVNTAFTYTCQTDSEIVVYRKEEWFKVLMHESFHNFALDFSNMNTSDCNNRILSIFKLNSEVNLFEAYTECWAEIMNAAFCSYYLSKKRTPEEFFANFDYFINFERTYKFFQMVKTLNFMGLNYKNLYANNTQSEIARKNLYREKSNVLSYYIITTILLNNYQGFLLWCDTNNLLLLQFKKSILNITEFCNFVEKNYKTKTMVESVECMQNFIYTLGSKSKSKNIDFILNNMRMTICELG